MILIDSVTAAKGQQRRACRKYHRVTVRADATLEQLALECHVQRITPRIRKILRRLEKGSMSWRRVWAAGARPFGSLAFWLACVPDSATWGVVSSRLAKGRAKAALAD